MITSGWQNVVKFTHLISKEDNNKCYVKFMFGSFQKLFKTINQSISCNVADFFYSENTQREIGQLLISF